MNETLRQAAMVAGRHAGSSKQPVTACPYDPNGDPTQRALAGAWMREYLRNRPIQSRRVDYTAE